MSYVFVLDSDRRPLMPCTSARARLLLRRGRAAVWRRFPFTIILKAAKPDAHVQPLRLKLDPGSRSSGLAIVDDSKGRVIFAAEITHRGEQVRKALAKRRAIRRSRRQRKTRYRPPRFDNRRRRQGWLAPSLNSRLANLLTWVARLRRWCPIGHLSLELVRFDTALMQEPELSGVNRS
jgi:RRXRR protein